MPDRKKTVAILTQSPALGSIISMVLDCEEQLFVQTFSHANMLKRHARIAPIDLVICDYQIGLANAPQLAIDIRQANSKRDAKFVVLADFISSQIRQACIFSNIDEVIVKPMSPLFLRDRVLAQLVSTQNTPPNNHDARAHDEQHKDAPLAGNIVYLHGKKRRAHKNPHL